jgi:hypothetical protein
MWATIGLMLMNGVLDQVNDQLALVEWHTGKHTTFEEIPLSLLPASPYEGERLQMEMVIKDQDSEDQPLPVSVRSCLSSRKTNLTRCIQFPANLQWRIVMSTHSNILLLPEVPEKEPSTTSSLKPKPTP